jgi:hypothetical protein
MENKQKEQLSGGVKRSDGTYEFFWKGRSYGCVVPEELIDEELSATENYKNKRSTSK